MSSNKNSISSSNEQILKLNKNAVEIITKLDQAVSSSSSSITVNIENPDGTVSTYQFPTIGYLKSEIDTLKRNLRTLAGLDGNSAVIQEAQNQYKRIIVSDLNLEPNDLDTVGRIETFRTDKNWIFDAMLNPMLSVELDLTNKIQDSVRKVLSRRFIVQFDKNADGSLTALGEERLKEFNTKYKGKDDVNIIEFVSWLGTPGLMNRAEPLYDEQIFDLLPHRLQYNGYFTVLRMDTDALNRKLWYILDTLDYQDVSNLTAPPTSKSLKVGDRVAVVPNTQNVSSTTVYKVAEVSTATSELRVRFEREQGDEPIPVRVSALRIYSPVVYEKKARISIGFDEYNVVFVKPLNANNHILAKNWSKGVGFYSSDLRLDSTSGMFLKDYYFQKVYDYGAVLQDLVAKKIPTSQGVVPNAPLLDENNFKVVQINKHLTDTPDAEKVRTLHNTKNTLKSELDQIQEAISKQNVIVSTSKSDSVRKQAEQALSTLTFKAGTQSSRFKSVVDEILAAKKNINKVEPKFRIRGFWAMPDAIQSSFSQPQEVVQFEVQYRYANLSGSESNIETFKNVGKKGVNAAFSNWNTLKTDVRKREYNSETGEWKWVIEDVSDADTPNINQLDIPITQNEQVEIRIRSVSEVGYPEAPLTSDWSEPLTIKFPSDLNLVLAEDDFILKEATQEETMVRIEKSLDAKGFVKHVDTSFSVGDTYYAHHAKTIASGFSNDSGQMVNLYDKLNELLLKIGQLEDQVKRAKGELKVTLIQTLPGGNIKEIAITNGSTNPFNIELESFVTTAKFGTVDAPINPPISRSYPNELKVLKDFKIRVENAAKDNILGLLSNRKYGTGTGEPDTAFAFSSDVQATWVDNDNNILSYDTGNVVYTQKDNQWIWLKNKGNSGTDIYYSDYNPASPTTGRDGDYTAIKYVHDGIKYNSNTSFEGNYGLRGDFTTSNTNTGTTKISDTKYWNIYQNAYSGATDTSGQFAVTVHPQIQDFNTIVEKSSDKLKLVKPGQEGIVEIPIMAYWKFSTIDELLDAKTSTWFAGSRDNKETVLRAMMTYFTISGISKASQAVLSFRTNGTGYSNASALPTTTVAVAGTPSGLTTTITTSSGAVITTATVDAGGSGYAVGDIVEITQASASGAYAVVVAISGGGATGPVTTLRPLTLYTLAEMGLGAADYLIVDGVAGMTEINNRLLRITTTNITTSTTSLTVAVNSTSFTTYTSGGAMAMITNVTIPASPNNDIQVWNSIGRDSTQNAPITRSMFVIAPVFQRTVKVIQRSLRFYLEPENSSRAFEFTLNFNFRQFKEVAVVDSIIDVGNINNNTLNIG